VNFRRELAEAVMAGSKTCTRRLVSDKPRSPWWYENCAYVPGQRIAICPGRGKHAIGHAVVTTVERMPLGRLSNAEAQAEGFGGRGGFVMAWTAINGSYDPAAIVWRIGLRASP